MVRLFNSLICVHTSISSFLISVVFCYLTYIGFALHSIHIAIHIDNSLKTHLTAITPLAVTNQLTLRMTHPNG